MSKLYKELTIEHMPNLGGGRFVKDRPFVFIISKTQQIRLTTKEVEQVIRSAQNSLKKIIK